MHEPWSTTICLHLQPLTKGLSKTAFYHGKSKFHTPPRKIEPKHRTPAPEMEETSEATFLG